MDQGLTEEEAQPQKTIESALAALQPLRDLAKNWDIDIASCLEEYLHELGTGGDLRESTSQNGEIVKPNFAQAALVLHNSSHIYSRKVEYLYSLVYQALDSLSAVNSQRKSTRGRTVDPELEDFREFDPHQEFLLLDDVLPTDKSEDCRHINLSSTPLDQEMSRRFSLASNALATPHGNLSMRTQNLSGSSVGRSFHTLSMSNALNQINTQSSGVLRLTDEQCDLDPSGRLLIPGCQSSPLLHAQAQPTTINHLEVEAEYAPGGDYDGDEDDDGPGFAMADDDSVGEGAVNIEEQAPQTARKRVTFAPENQAPSSTDLDYPDPWALLDPHSVDGRKPRPLKLGKTLRLPAGIDDLPSDCVSGSHTRKWKTHAEPPPFQKADHKFFTTETFNALSRKRRLHDEESDSDQSTTAEILPTVPLKGLLYGQEFAYLAREHTRRKAADRRILRHARKNAETKNPLPSVEPSTRDDYDDDNDDFGPGYVFADDDDDDHDGGPLDDDGRSPIVETNTGLRVLEEVYGSANDDDTDSVADARTFEALCRAHIARFAKGAEKYASETHLTQRVDQWQEKLEPILTEEENRPEFDIHKYGETVLETLGKITGSTTKQRSDEASTRVADFGEVTSGCPRYQVCRYFLASLSLCNSGNILLEQNGEGTNTLSVRLLSTETNRPMETYLAPSVADQTT